jgi:nicotinate-nucleotide--dimethylbenzimidazole phosphoribosyltransferase
LSDIRKTLLQPVSVPNATYLQRAIKRQAKLTKPPGSLGRLEDIAIQLATIQAVDRPHVDSIHITVFAADHGVAAENISAFPQSVTVEMIKNFSCGGAAICVLARELGALLEIVNLGTVTETHKLMGVMNLRLGPGTANLCREPAMRPEQLDAALEAGQQAVLRAHENHAHLFIGGEMGIGNTTSAAALACALLNAKPEQLAGPGTGLDTQGVAHKIQIIRQALDLHGAHIDDPMEALRRLGGFEIAALTGSYLACVQMKLPVLVDGFISSVAALCAARLCPGVEQWFLFAHSSAEPGHRTILDAMNSQPLLDLGMRLGEASGAALAVHLLRSACVLHNEMATFEEAGVSTKATS